MFWAAVAAALPLWAALWWLHPSDHPLQYLATHPRIFFMMAIAYPVVEEIVFRGAIQGYLANRTGYRLAGPISMANLATSLAFAMLHGIVWANFWSLLVFFPSLVFGYLRDMTGGLAAPIILHAFYNAGFFLVTASQVVPALA